MFDKSLLISSVARKYQDDLCVCQRIRKDFNLLAFPLVLLTWSEWLTKGFVVSQHSTLKNTFNIQVHFLQVHYKIFTIYFENCNTFYRNR